MLSERRVAFSDRIARVPIFLAMTVCVYIYIYIYIYDYLQELFNKPDHSNKWEHRMLDMRKCIVERTDLLE